MPNIIKDGEVSNDTWIILDKDFTGDPPQQKIVLPMQYWLDNRDNLSLTIAGLWIDSDEDVEAVGHEINLFPLVAVNFPTFTDGRGFSIGRLLRERYQYNGQLRAIGNVISDQLFYLKRCGFNAFDLKAGTDLVAALELLNSFTTSYQGAVDQTNPLFRRSSK